MGHQELLRGGGVSLTCMHALDTSTVAVGLNASHAEQYFWGVYGGSARSEHVRAMNVAHDSGTVR